MLSTDQHYSAVQQDTLLQIAARSIQHGLRYRSPLEVNPFQFDEALQEKRATFVTLEKHGQLRGCIGMLKAIKPLIVDVASNAYSAAFNDPRFPELSNGEYKDLDIHISILTPPEPFPVNSEEELLQKLVPNEDGLILRDGFYQATFLPSVWESLPSAELFLAHLKQKAGLSNSYWSDTIEFQRYHTLSFGKLAKEIELEKEAI